jgi:hypothetical protein
MFTPGGQIDLLSFAGLRGGGKGGGGGGGGYAPPAPIIYTDPVTGKSFTQAVDPNTGQPTGPSAQDALNQEISDRQASDKATSDAAAAKKAADDAAALATFQGNRDTAYNDARNAVLRQFTQQGIDPNQYLASDIDPALQRQLHSIKDLDPNPSAAFSPDLGTTIINSLTSSKRTGASNQLNTLFSPTYSNTAVPDSLTGQYSGTLLDEQFNPLSAQLQNAQKRGTLTDAGYNAALAALTQKRSAAQSTINDLGTGIISKDRGAIDDYISKARSNANALNLSSNFDPNVYASGAKNLADTDISNFGGALRSAVSGTQFASLSDLINAGGAVQGATNPNAANPLGTPALNAAAVADQDPNKKRGLGSTGSF